MHGKVSIWTPERFLSAAACQSNGVSFAFPWKKRSTLQLIEKIGLISSDLKSDIVLYKAACKVERLKAIEVAYNQHHNVAISSDGPTCTHSWRFSSDEGFRKAIPAGFTKL